MSNHDSIRRQQVPKVVSLGRTTGLMSPKNVGTKPQVPVEGQGTVTFTVAKDCTEAMVSFWQEKEEFPKLILRVTQSDANILWQEDAGSTPQHLPSINPELDEVTIPDDYTTGIDSNPYCVYWVSVDSLNKVISYGKGEMRQKCALARVKYDEPRTIFTPVDQKGKFPWIGKLKNIGNSNKVFLSHAWKEPVAIEPPVAVVPSSDFTMNEAATYAYSTPESLSQECQRLYANVAGNDFKLNTPDFPDFSQAIEYSLRTPGCIAYEIIKRKLEVGEFDPMDKDGYVEVYLRITMGVAQGDSPGIPYVLEIWPAGCGSPIHNHGFTNAIIKVLRGSIDVDLFRMLPQDADSAQPFRTAVFNEGDVTYIMPQVNQIHRLRNNTNNTDTCITIQCYRYPNDNDIHWPYFDYVGNDDIEHFDPISDSDFLTFKRKVKEEWDAYKAKRTWEIKEVMNSKPEMVN